MRAQFHSGVSDQLQPISHISSAIAQQQDAELVICHHTRINRGARTPHALRDAQLVYAYGAHLGSSSAPYELGAGANAPYHPHFRRHSAPPHDLGSSHGACGGKNLDLP